MFIPIWVGWPFWIGAFFTLSTVRAQLSGVVSLSYPFSHHSDVPKRLMERSASLRAFVV